MVVGGKNSVRPRALSRDVKINGLSSFVLHFIGFVNRLFSV
eukprot:CAMPEP_0181312584 /NCGR_PEP_ID=MMETSP1101-20121128/13776_1 /TAXON_ID=46948 /ORGANISM="Rhodomonas abbreviata, Strain Caron Lab Isolate" /LENGTH=40 /DNA_ID= /DNA_START= /DNA_END= /DNA_ORIENTATION=